MARILNGNEHRWGARVRVYIPVHVASPSVTGIDGRPITGQMDLNLALNRKRPGDTVKVEYYRGGQKMEAQVTLNDASR